MAFIGIFRDTFRQVVAQTLIFWMIGFVLLLLLIAAVVDLPTYEEYKAQVENWNKWSRADREVAPGEVPPDEVEEIGAPVLGEKIELKSRDEWARGEHSDIVVRFDWVVFMPFSMIFIVSASFLVTRKLGRGLVEQYLSKPVSRFTIFTGRSVAIYLVFMIPAALCLIGIHCILAARFGVSCATFVQPLAYAAILGFSITGLCTALGNLTRGPILCIVVFTMLLVVSFVIILFLNMSEDGFVAGDRPEQFREESTIKNPFLELLYDLLILVRRYVFIPALDCMILAAFSHDPAGAVYTWRPVWVGLAQGVLGFGIGALAFVRRDF